MPDIHSMGMGKVPPDWRVFLEGSQTPAGNVAWSISPEVASGMTADKARALAESLNAFLRTLIKSSRR